MSATVATSPDGRVAHHGRSPVVLQADAAGSGVSCLAMLLAPHGLPPDRDALRYLLRGASVDDLDGLTRACGQLGWRARITNCAHPGALPEAPFIAQYRGRHFVVVEAVTARRVSIIDPASGRMELPAVQFRSLWTERALCVDGTADATRVAKCVRRIVALAGRRRDARARIARTLGRSHWRAATLLLGASLILQISRLAAPIVLQQAVDAATRQRLLAPLTAAGAALVLLALVNAVLTLARASLLSRTRTRVEHTLVQAALGQVLAASQNSINGFRSSELLARLQAATTLRHSLSARAFDILLDPVAIAIALTLLAVYDRWLASVAAVVTVLSAVIGTRHASALRTALGRKFAAGIAVNSSLADTLQGNITVKSWTLRRLRLAHWGRRQVHLARATNAAEMLDARTGLMSLGVADLGQAAVYVFAAVLTIKGQATVGTLVAVVALYSLIISRSASIPALASIRTDFVEAIDRIAELLSLPPEAVRDGPAGATADANGLRLRDVHYHFAILNTEVLRAVSFEVPLRSFTAVVGHNGSGKSTLLRVIARIYDDYEGDIHYGGRDIGAIRGEEWRQKCRYVAGDDHLFEGTVRDNLLIVRGGATEAELTDVLEAGGLLRDRGEAEIILGRQLFPGGTNLSYGQRQRLIFARLLLARPHIALVDELTSGMDIGAERRFVDTLRERCPDSTIILVTHRPEIALRADTVLCLDRGRVVEHGAPKWLLQGRGHFAVMCGTCTPNAEVV